MFLNGAPVKLINLIIMKEINNDITEDYCSYEVSKLLKEKMFGLPCYKCYDLNGNNYNLSELWSQGCESGMSLEDWCNDYNLPHFNLVSKPTHELAIKWILDNFGIDIHAKRLYKRPIVDEPVSIVWIPRIDDINAGGEAYADSLATEFNAPEDAIEAALLYTLQNLIK